MKKRHRTGLIVFIFMIIAFVGFGSFYVCLAKNKFVSAAEARAIALARSACSFLDTGLLEGLDGDPGDINKPEYLRLKEGLAALKAADEDIASTYIMRLKDGKIYIAVDSEQPESANYSPPGQVYYEGEDADYSALANGQPIFVQNASDRWGQWTAAMTPIIDAVTREPVAVIGIDYSAEKWNSSVNSLVIQEALMVLMFLLLALLICLLFLSLITIKRVSRRAKASAMLFKAIFEQAPIGIAVVSGYNFLSDMNLMFEKIMGRPKEEIATLSWIDLTHPDDVKADLELFERFKNGQINGYSMEKRYIKPDGSYIWVNIVIAALNQSRYKRGQHLCLIQDITEQKRVLDALLESERSKGILLSHLPGMAYRRSYDGEHAMQFVSEGCVRLTGYSPSELTGASGVFYNDLIAPEYKARLSAEWERALSIKAPFRYEYELTSAAGKRRWVLEMGQGVYDQTGAVEAIEGIIIDITDQKMREKELKYINDHDFLTGVFNRKYYEDAKQRLDIEGCLPLSVMLLNINGMRLINDAFGHAEGDRVIEAAAGILRSCCKKEYTLARTGGDEFCILMPNTPSDEAGEIARRITAICETHSFKKAKQKYKVNLSLGIGTKTSAIESLREAEKTAETEMYNRKLLNQKSSHGAILSSIMATMYSTGYETEEHALRIASLCKLIGEKLGLPQKSLDELELFSMLHDIGKVGIDERILNKPGPLTADEWAVMKKHPEIGCRIAMASPELEPVAQYILSHHERWDGGGYPSGLCKEEIPLLSRILSVTDAYDAMTQDRVYRKAVSPDEALNEIKQKAGTQFDPAIVEIFVEYIEKDCEIKLA